MSDDDLETYAVSYDDLPDQELIPVGTYEGFVEKADLQLSKSSQLPSLALSIRIPTTSFPVDYDVDNAPNGLLMMSHFSMYADGPNGTPSAAPTKAGYTAGKRVLKNFPALHDGRVFEWARIPELGGYWGWKPYVVEMLVGQPVRVNVKHEAYRGEMQAKIDSLSPVV